jgi:two-component system cell cycle response regulator
MLGAFLEKSGFQVITAADGLDAVQAVYSQFPDVVLLDITMPRMNGYQVCRLLKNDEQTKSIPVVMFTSKDKGIEKYLGLETGADAYVTKDIEYDSLLRVICEQLEKRAGLPSAARDGNVPVTLTDVLMKINHLLDRKLYEVTMVNRIVMLARDIRAYGDIVDEVLGIVSEVMNSPVAVFGITDMESLRLFVKCSSQLHEEDLKAIEKFCLAQVKEDHEETSLMVHSTVLAPEDVPGDRKLIAEQGALYAFRTRSCVRSREWRGFVLCGRDIRDRAGPERAVMELMLEQALVVIENAHLYETVRLKSVTDELTRLYNRRHFFERLRREYQRICRHNGKGLAVLLMDIDHFNGINDSYGHPAGDDVLRDLARILISQTRATDTAARFGGEEFIVLLPETDLEGGATFAERVRKAVEAKAFLSNGLTISVTISIGVSAIQDGQVTEEEAIGQADKALYRAKTEGRNRVCVHEGT